MTKNSKPISGLPSKSYTDQQFWDIECNTRRVDDHIWVRVNELILPNFTQAGSAFAADGTKTRYFGRSSFTR